MNMDRRGADLGEGYAYRRRYLDEDVWEEVDAATARRALGDAYRNVSLVLDSCTRREASARRRRCLRCEFPDRDRR